MKTIDRYVLATFVKNWAITFMVLVGMYMVLDMVFNIDNLTSFKADPAAEATLTAWAVVGNIADYYFHHGFLFFNQLAGIIPVVAAAFTLIRLSRFNELTAVLAAGVPLLRVAAPILIAGLVLNGLVIVNQELVIPRMAHKLTRDHNDIHGSSDDDQPIIAMQDERNALLYAGRYFVPRDGQPATMKDVDVVERDAEGQPLGKLMAAWATWDGLRGGWVLEDGRRFTGLAADAGALAQQPADFWATSINPEEIELYRNSNFVELLGTERINQLLARPKSYGAAALLRIKHWRFTQPIMNFVLLLLAVPCVLTREPSQLKTAATKTLFFAGLAMGSVFLFHNLANSPPSPEWATQWPALMAWVPIFIFGPVAVFLLDRVKT